MAVAEIESAPENGLVLAEGVTLTAGQLANAEMQLAEWGRNGDSGALSEARAQTEAAVFYARRNGYRIAANQYARLKIHCEVNIGLIDRRRVPKLPRHSQGLELGGQCIDGVMRRVWRTFSMVDERGLLNEALDDLDDLDWRSVRDEIARRGLVWVPSKPLLDHVESRGMTFKEIAEKLGLASGSSVSWSLHRIRMRWDTAARIADASGFDLSPLPPVPCPSALSARAKRKAERQAAKAALARERQGKEIKRALVKAGEAMNEAWVMAERFQDVIAQAQRETEDREAREALSLAGRHSRKMRDEIVRALGVS